MLLVTGFLLYFGMLLVTGFLLRKNHNLYIGGNARKGTGVEYKWDGTEFGA